METTWPRSTSASSRQPSTADSARPGRVAFEKLYQDVLAGYRKPWFHGIEHLTLDHEGYVYWKSQQVEHYNMPWAGSEEARQQAEELAERCRTLEGRGLPVNTTTIVWRWPESLNAVPA